MEFLPHLSEGKIKSSGKFALLKLNEIRSLSGTSNPNKIKIIENTEKGKEDIGRWLNRLLHSEEDASVTDTISRLTKSELADDRIEAVTLIAGNSQDETTPYLVELINDANYSVQSAAILVAGKINKPELYTFLIDKLSSSTYGDLAITSIVEIGDDIIPYLDLIFQKTDLDPQTQLRIIKIFERISTENQGKSCGQKLIILTRKWCRRFCWHFQILNSRPIPHRTSGLNM
jgi:hypothetical protein